MKVLHLPTSVAGQAFALCEAERALGIESDFLLVFKDNYYPEIPSMFDTTPKSPIDALRYLPSLIRMVRKISKGNDYDILHFNFSRSLIDYPGLADLVDIGMYPQKIFVTCNGCDVRMRSMGLPYSPCDDDRCWNRVCTPGGNQMKLNRIAKWRDVAAKIFVSTPDLLRSVPDAMFIPNTIYGFDGIQEVPAKPISEPLTIIHAPTNRFIKGTDVIARVVNELKAEGHEINLITSEGVERSRALEVYGKADIAIDQLRLGWYGVFAMECMKMGIPTMSYCRNQEYGMIPESMARDLRHSLINVTFDTLKTALKYYVDNREELQQYRRNGIAFVNRWHSPKHIASLLKKEYEKVM